MIKSLLIANRGEIAVRIIRACKEMDIRAVAVYSEADRDSLHVKMADEAICIGPAPSSQSYLNQKNLITAAIQTHCDAIHPGVGFLSENDTFAQAVKDANLIFIGAEPEAIRMLGDKVQAKHIAEKAGIPTIPGSKEAITNPKRGLEVAEEMGFPVIIKASAGGGGKGMRIVRSPDQLESSLTIASNEALTNFANGDVYIEKYLEDPRHVEIQILSDGKGNVVHLGERDCSVQKNHQKLIEESPSTRVTPEMREQMGQDAVRLFKSLKYSGAGTIEFLVFQGKYYFMEVNARVQVEHPVTEFITGVDIIRQQILAASGTGLEITQEDINLTGYAMECRINALTPGKVTHFSPPLGPMTRVDTFLYPNCTVSPHYDSMVAKVIIKADNRQQGIKRMKRALNEFQIEGIKVNIEEQMKILSSPPFISGNFGTDLYAKISKE